MARSSPSLKQSRHSREWIVPLRGIIAAVVLVGSSIALLHWFGKSPQWIMTMAIVTAVAIVIIHSRFTDRLGIGSEWPKLVMADWTKVAIGLVAALGAWIGYFVYINGLHEKIVHGSTSVAQLQSRRRTWISITFGQIMIFWFILLVLVLLERSPKNSELRRLLAIVATAVLILHVLNVLTIIPDLDEVLNATTTTVGVSQTAP